MRIYYANANVVISIDIHKSFAKILLFCVGAPRNLREHFYTRFLPISAECRIFAGEMWITQFFDNGMNETQIQYEYELIDIVFELSYTATEVKENSIVCEDEVLFSAPSTTTDIELDANGIPKGGSQKEIQQRRQIIHNYIQAWRAEHADDPRVFNDNLNEYIKVTQVFLLESVSHAAKRYQSTKAVLQMSQIMSKASIVGITNKKEGNSNQRAFEKMIVMRYQSKELGNVKMTVGVRNRTHEKVEYSITVPPQGEPFISATMKKNTKNAKRKKRSR